MALLYYEADGFQSSPFKSQQLTIESSMLKFKYKILTKDWCT